MTDSLSLSTFTVEADRIPVIAFQCRRQAEAEAILAEETFLAQLLLVRSGGKPLCDNFSIFRIRIARGYEKAIFDEKAASILTGTGQLAVFLVDLDDPPAGQFETTA